MADVFDPYHKWLGILPKDQPPHHYRLLAIEPFESDPDVIAMRPWAAERYRRVSLPINVLPHSASKRRRNGRPSRSSGRGRAGVMS
jgi:hypothetical protein